MFEPRPWRVVDPPQRVLIRVSDAISHAGGRAANDLPLRVRAEGLDLDVQVTALLSGWARTLRTCWESDWACLRD